MGTSVVLNVEARLDRGTSRVSSRSRSLARYRSRTPAPAAAGGGARRCLVSGLHGLHRIDSPSQRPGRAACSSLLQLAMSLVLLISAGLFTRAFRRALLIDPGLDARNVVTHRVSTWARTGMTRRAARRSMHNSRRASRRDQTSMKQLRMVEFTPLRVPVIGGRACRLRTAALRLRHDGPCRPPTTCSDSPRADRVRTGISHDRQRTNIGVGGRQWGMKPARAPTVAGRAGCWASN